MYSSLGYGKFYFSDSTVEITTNSNGEYDLTVNTGVWSTKKPVIAFVANCLAGTLISQRYNMAESNANSVKVRLQFAEKSLTFTTVLSVMIVAPIE